MLEQLLGPIAICAPGPLPVYFRACTQAIAISGSRCRASDNRRSRLCCQFPKRGCKELHTALLFSQREVSCVHCSINSRQLIRSGKLRQNALIVSCNAGSRADFEASETVYGSLSQMVRTFYLTGIAKTTAVGTSLPLRVPGESTMAFLNDSRTVLFAP